MGDGRQGLCSAPLHAHQPQSASGASQKAHKHHLLGGAILSKFLTQLSRTHWSEASVTNWQWACLYPSVSIRNTGNLQDTAQPNRTASWRVREVRLQRQLLLLCWDEKLTGAAPSSLLQYLHLASLNVSNKDAEAQATFLSWQSALYEYNSKLLSLATYCYPGELAKLYFDTTGLARQLAHLPVPSLTGLLGRLQINDTRTE